MNVIIRSILLIEEEKLVLLSEEIKYLYDICRFHSSNDDYEHSIKKDLELNFTIIQNQLKYIYNTEVEFLFKNIIDTLLSNGAGYNNTELLYYIDYYKYKVGKIIKKLKIINQKISQMFRDGYDQYIPKPIPSRMFSNINLTAQAEQDLRRRYEDFFPENNNNENRIDVQVIWEYSGSYRVTEYLKDSDKSRILIFRMSYWYFDLPVFVPMLTHELGHIAINKIAFGNTKTKFMKKLEKMIKQDALVAYALKNKIEYYSQLSNEVFADILSFFHHGDAYLLTTLHSLLGYHLASTLEYDEKNKAILVSSWGLEYKRDSAFIRIYLLLEIRNILKIHDKKELFREEDFKNILSESHELLDLFYKEKEYKSGFVEYYNENHWHNYLDDFENTRYVVLYLKDVFIKFFNDDSESFIKKFEYMQNKNDKDKDSQTCDYIPQHFNDIWKKRFQRDKNKNFIITDNKIPHKFEFRKRIHNKTLKYLITEKMLEKDYLKAFELIYYKYKINDLSEDEKKFLKNKLNNLSQNNSADDNNNNISYAGYVLGIYDQVKFRKLNENSVQPKLKEIKDEEKRYISKNSLIKILTDFESKPANDTLKLNLIIQIEIMKNLDKDDIYNNLINDIKKIYNLFENKDYKYSKVETFKSLGSKDLVIFIKDLDIDSLYNIKDKISSMFPRIFSIITYSEINELSLSDNYLFFTEIRMNKNFHENEYINNIQNSLKDYKEKITSMYNLIGTMDYRIIWNEDTNLSDIFNFYTQFIDSQYITDMQTRISKKLPSLFQ